MLKGFIAAAVLALAPLAAPAGGQPRAAGPVQDEAAAVDFALARGRLLYAVDRAAWVATDDLQEKMRDWQSAGLRGYVVERDGDGFQVLYYGGPAQAPVAFYRARVANDRVASSEVLPADARPALTPLQRRLVAARDLVARSTRRRPCGSAPFNSAVVPPETPDGPIDVYLMTPQAAGNVYPLGGHYRATVAADGSISGERAFMNSCMDMPAPPPGAVGFVVTHLLDPVPTEIHVFTAIAARASIYVGTTEPRRVFEVTADRIRLVQGRRLRPSRRN